MSGAQAPARARDGPARPTVARLSAADLTTLATDRGSVPMQIGALLLFAEGSEPPATRLVTALEQRLARVPRLRERLRRAPFGCGRPYWERTGVPTSSLVTVVPAPDDEARLTDAAVAEVARSLPRDRPLWRAVVYADAGERVRAVVVVMHHVLADGMGGLAVLAQLVDPDGDPGEEPVRGTVDGAAYRRPTRRELRRDAWAERRAALRATPAALRGLAAGVRELGGIPRLEAAPSSLLRPTSSQRRVALVDVELAGVLAAARAHGATVNDLLVVAVAGALRRVLAARGEHLSHVVVSVPVSGRDAASGRELGNRVGVLPVTVPLAEDPAVRLAAVRQQRARLDTAAPRASSQAVITPLFRALAALGVFGWFIDRQRLVHTFLTNLRGPSAPLALAGGRIRRIVPLALTPGNVTVSFDVLSYAGRLVVAVLHDPEHVPDAALLRDALAQELAWS